MEDRVVNIQGVSVTLVGCGTCGQGPTENEVADAVEHRGAPEPCQSCGKPILPERAVACHIPIAVAGAPVMCTTAVQWPEEVVIMSLVVNKSISSVVMHKKCAEQGMKLVAVKKAE